jgi:carboxylesterase
MIMLASRERTLQELTTVGRGEAAFSAPGRAPCVVAFHGFGGTAAELRPLLDGIARAGYAVDGALLPGHGTRAEELQGVTFDQWLDAARTRLRDALRSHGSAVVLGFSLGSLLALGLAAEGAAGLAGAVVLGNALRLAMHSRLPLGLVARLGLPVPDVYLLKPQAGDLVDPAAMDDLLSYDRHPLRSAVEVYRGGKRIRTYVGRVTCPTLVLHGKRDRVCPWQNAVWLAGHLGTRDVSLRLFERSGHVLACDGEREAVMRETVAFLGRFDGAP